MGKKVLLVDTDLRKSRLSQRGLSQRGLSDILCGKISLEDCVVNSSETFDFLSIGAKTANPNELLSSNGFKEFLKQIKEKYDVILLDAPPINVVADAQSIAPLVDFALLVVKFRKDSIEDIQEAVKTLDVVGQEKRAVVMNQCYNDGSFQGYSYYYKYK